ncbi:MAG: SLBB domain-containing protein [Bacteriovoracia bacterium]
MKTLSFLLVFLFSFSPVWSREEVFTVTKLPQNSNEFFAGGYPGATMMKVHVVGGVHKPGVYNVPVNSELNSVISYAGGPTKEAEFDEVFIKSKRGEDFVVKKVDMKEFFANPKETPYRLRPDDYVYVNQKEQLIDDNTFRTIVVFSTIVATVLSAITIDRTLER